MASTDNQNLNCSSDVGHDSLFSSDEAYLPADLDLDNISDDEKEIQKAAAYIRHHQTKTNIKPPSI
jgi:hypothetical protein